MSNSQSFSYSSFSYSSSSTGDGQPRGHAYAKQSHTDPSGTTTRTTTQNLGERPVQETRYYDSQGRELVGDAQDRGPAAIDSGRVQELTDESEADRAYKERIEDEYAKREGGA